MPTTETLTYRGAILYMEFGDSRPDQMVESPLRPPEVLHLSGCVRQRSGTVLESSPKRLYALFSSGESALGAAQDARQLITRLRLSDVTRNRLGSRAMLGYGMVTVVNGHLKSDWTYRLPGQNAQVPFDTLGASPEFARHMGTRLMPWLTLLPNAREPIYVVGDIDGQGGVSRMANALNITTPPGYSVLTLRVRGLPHMLHPGDGPLTVGRDATCGLRISTETASRRHGRFDHVDGKFIYSDHSRNGSYLLTQAGEEIFLLGETMELSGEGAISAGAPIAQQTGEVVRFECQRSFSGDDDERTIAAATRSLRLG